MHKRAEPSAKHNNQMRWEQGRMLFEEIAPTLPTPSHVLVLAYCWFRGRGRDCCFDESHQQIADATKLKRESVRRIIRSLEVGQVIKTVKNSGGRGHTSKRVITGRKFEQIKGVADDHL